MGDYIVLGRELTASKNISKMIKKLESYIIWSMDNNWHVVKKDERYVVLQQFLTNLVPSITKLNPNKSTSGHINKRRRSLCFLQRNWNNAN